LFAGLTFQPQYDWDFAGSRGKPVYVIDLDLNVYRLDPETLKADRKNNPNHWRFKSSNPNICLERAQ
jgi:hypothetical protein